MISDKKLAEKISEKILEINHLMSEAIDVVVEQGKDNEKTVFCEAAGVVLGEILINIMNPLYTRHPSLKPPDLYLPGIDNLPEQ